jgi:hypothetical protein
VSHHAAQGANNGVSGLIFDDGSGEALTVRVRYWQPQLTPQPFRYIVHGTAGRKVTPLATDAQVQFAGEVVKGEMGLNNIGDRTNGNGTLTLKTKQGRTLAGNGHLGALVIRATGGDKQRLTITGTVEINGDLTESATA